MYKSIDVHAHFGNYRDSKYTEIFNESMSGSAEIVAERAEKAGVKYTIVSALKSLFPDGRDVIRGNEEAVKASGKIPSIFFWAVLEPKKEKNWKQVDILLKHEKCKGVKIHPLLHDYNLKKYCDEIFSFCNEKKIVLITHSGCPGTYPEDFIPFADKFPDVKLILSHLGNGPQGDISKQINAIKSSKNKNVYTDTSSICSIYGSIIEIAVSIIGSKRMLLGTDSPLYFTSSQKIRIEHAKISEPDKKRILYENANKLLFESEKGVKNVN